MEDVIAATAQLPGSEAALRPQRIDAGYGASLGSDVAGFAGALERAAGNGAPSPVAKAMMQPLDFIDGEATGLMEYAESAMASENELSPSEIVMLTARSQEFMFHAQLTANVANRTSEGMQQLFRQQS